MMHKRMADEVMLTLRLMWNVVPEADREAFYVFTGGISPVEAMENRLKKFVAEGSEMEEELLCFQLKLARETNEATGQFRALRQRPSALNLRLVTDETLEG